MEENKAIIIYTTYPTEETALNAGRGLVNNRLAAGINLFGPGKSIYHWQGLVKERPEWYLLAQSMTIVFEEARRFIIDNHPYEIPCILFWNIAGHDPFLDWIFIQCTQKNN